MQSQGFGFTRSCDAVLIADKGKNHAVVCFRTLTFIICETQAGFQLCSSNPASLDLVEFYLSSPLNVWFYLHSTNDWLSPYLSHLYFDSTARSLYNLAPTSLHPWPHPLLVIIVIMSWSYSCHWTARGCGDAALLMFLYADRAADISAEPMSYENTQIFCLLPIIILQL